MVMYQPPTIPEGQTVLTRALLQIILDDIHWMACQTGLIGAHSIPYGVGGMPGLDSLRMLAGALVTAREGTIEAATPPAEGTYILVMQADVPTWVAYDTVRERAIT